MDKKNQTKQQFTKKCPDCLAELHVEERICHSCKTQVGSADEHGIAQKPGNLKAYLYCIFAWVLFAYYIWWAFLKGK